MRFFLLAAIAIVVGGNAWAQAPPGDLERTLDIPELAPNVGDGLHSLSVFGAIPGTSGARYWLDDAYPTGDATLAALKLSGGRDFGGDNGERFLPHLELTAAWVTTEQNIPLDVANSGGPTIIESEFEVSSLVGGAGVAMRIDEGTRVRIVGLVGYTSTKNDAQFIGPLAGPIDDLTRGVLYNMDMDSTIYGVSLVGLHRRDLTDTLRLRADVRYSHVVSDTLDASSPLLDVRSEFDVVSGRVELEGDQGWKFWNRDLHWVSFLGATWLPGDQNKALGFDQFMQAGAGLQLMDDTILDWAEGARIESSYIFGDNVTGFTIGARLVL